MTGIRKATISDLGEIKTCAIAAYKMYVERIGREPAPMVANFAASIGKGHLYVAQEEGQIVARWLGRVNECLAEQSPGLFEKAARRARISRRQLQTGEGLSHEHFDKVVDNVRRDHPEIILCYLSRVLLDKPD